MLAGRVDEGGQAEPWPELYEELERLPERYRAPLVFCYLEGLTHEQAAGKLHWALRTVRSRLVRGRERLRGRLARRGVTLSAAALASTGTPGRASAAMSAAWVERTVRAAIRIATGEATAAVASVQVTLWTEGVLRRMFLTKLMTAAISVLAIGGTAAAVWLTGGMAPGGAGLDPATPLLALSRDRIPAYELRAAGAADPADASPSLVAILGDSRLKMMEYVGRMAFTPDGRSLVSAGNHEIAFWDPRVRRAAARPARAYGPGRCPGRQPGRADAGLGQL